MPSNHGSRQSHSTRWRQMTSTDLPGIERIASRVHADHPEDIGVFAERLKLYPAGCLALEGREGTIGYVVSHPWLLAQPPALNSYLRKLSARPDTFYIHDMALMPTARGSGAGRTGVELLVERARQEGLRGLSLIAVGGSLGFWQRQGFRVVDDAGIRSKLLSYGTAAHFMVRRLL
jgi:ribosomal protein S18 acetylase RimI-like enzyme